MKKVLFVTTISGFLQQFEMNDVKILQEMGCEVQYASNFCNPVYEMNYGELKKMKIKLHQISIQKSPIHVFKNTKTFFQLRRILKKEKIDTIHCHNPMGGVLGRLAAWSVRQKVCVIYTAHGFHFYKGAPLFNRLFYFPVEYVLARFTDRLITINSEDYQRAIRFHLHKDGYVQQIPGVGVYTARFAPQAGIRETVREKLKLKKDDFFILSVGELNQNKNHQVILEALAQLQDQKIYYGICGRGSMETELKKKAKSLGVENRVMLFGFRKDIPKMLAAADCFAFPSKREGLGIAALEAAAAGIPLIASDCRGTKEYMEQEVNGIVCREGTVKEYADAIRRLRNSREMREKMSEECLKTAARFDISVTDKIMRKVYESCNQCYYEHL